MDENAKIYLYMQLQDMVEHNTKSDAPKIISQDEFMAMPDNFALSYIFLYRDLFTTFLDENGEKIIGIIELPSMDLSGQDLSMVFLHDFALSTRDENGAIVPSTINMNGTKANICLTEMMPSRVETGTSINDILVFDFNIVNFKGCNVYGFLADETQDLKDPIRKLGYSISIEGMENGLDDEYIGRREKRKTLDKDEIAFVKRAYSRISTGKSLDGLSGIVKYEKDELEGDFSDYDFSFIEDRSVLARLRKKSFAHTGWENHKKCKVGFIEALVDFEQIDVETRCKVIESLLKDDKAKLVDSDYKKILDIEKSEFYEDDYRDIIKEILKSEKIKDEKIIVAMVIILLEKGKKLRSFYSRDYCKNIIQAILQSEKIKDENKVFELVEKLLDIGKSKNNGDDYSSIIQALLKSEKITDENKIFELLEKAIEEGKSKFYGENYRDIIQAILKSENIKDEKKVVAMVEILLEEGIKKHISSSFSRDYCKDIIQAILRSKKIKDENKVFEWVEKLLDIGKNQFTGENYSDIIQAILRSEEIKDENKVFELVERLLDIGKGKNNGDDYSSIIQALLKSEKITDENKIFELLEKAIEEGKSGFYGINYRVIIQAILKSEKIKDENKSIEWVEKILEEGKSEFYGKNYRDIIQAILKSKKIKDENKTLELVEKILEEGKRKFDEEDCTNIIKSLLQCDKITDDNSKIKLIISIEKSTTITQGKREVSADGQLLNELLDNPSDNTDLIIGLIAQGTDVNFTSYSNSGKCPKYTPSLYKVMMIKDDTIRKKIIEKMLDAGVDINAQYREIDFTVEPPKRKTRRVLEMNNGELGKIIEERKKATLKLPSIQDFLKDEVQLSEEDISRIKNTFEMYGLDIYKASLDKLRTIKILFDVCNATKQGFKGDPKILFNTPEVLFSRIAFFAEAGIRIDPNRLSETIGLTKKEFAKRYGKRLGIENKGDRYADDVKRALIHKYPMPKDEESLKQKLEEISRKIDETAR